MIKRKILRKIFVTTLSIFVAFVIYIIPNKISNNAIFTNKEIEFIKKNSFHNIYLLNDDNFLVEYKILIDNLSTKEKIKYIIDNLMITNKKNPDNLKGLIPVNTKILDINIENQIIQLNFSKDFLNISEEIEEAMIESLIYSLCNLKNIKGISLYVESDILKNTPSGKSRLPIILNKSYGINKIFNLNSNKFINKTSIYYTQQINNTNYFVPVTKYTNDKREKIEIIVENLTSNYIYENNLMSFLNKNVKLNNYKIDEGILLLELSDEVFTNNNNIKEEVLYTLTESIFNSYPVETIVLNVEGSEFSKKILKIN